MRSGLFIMERVVDASVKALLLAVVLNSYNVRIWVASGKAFIDCLL